MTVAIQTPLRNLGMPSAEGTPGAALQQDGFGLDLPLFVDVLSQLLPQDLLPAVADTETAETSDAQGTQADGAGAASAINQGAQDLDAGLALRLSLAVQPLAAGLHSSESGLAATSGAPVSGVSRGAAMPDVWALRMMTAAGDEEKLPAGAKLQGVGIDADAANALTAKLADSGRAAAAGAVQSVGEGQAKASGQVQASSPLAVDGAPKVADMATVVPATGHAQDAQAPLALHPRQPSLWQRPLAQALGERLQIQGAQGQERAVIRLDPPMLGRVEIILRQEGGSWQVQLSATHADVTRQLQSISEGLRQELSVRQQASVTVQVASDHLGSPDGRQQRQRQESRDEPPARASGGDEKDTAQTFDLA